jgi:glycosyltransferase involved in cell wall biosynthesis
MFSIVIPSWNNKLFLECCIHSIQQNSLYTHQIIVHVNDGSDGSLAFVQENNIDHTHSADNIGVCSAVNKAAAFAKHDYICYMNDDMYCTKNWDKALVEKLQQHQGEKLLLSATMIEPKDTKNTCVLVQNFGSSPSDFEQQQLEQFASTAKKENWSGAFWPPNVMPKFLWEEIGGFDEHFSPGMSSDDDIVHRLWNAGCRKFIGIGNSFVYHFMSKSTGRITKNNGPLQYLQRYGITQGSFRKYYLQLGKTYIDDLSEPNWIAKWMLKMKGIVKRLLK